MTIRENDVVVIPTQIQSLFDDGSRQSWLPVDAELIYHSLDPYAVTLSLPPISDDPAELPTTRTWSRELTAEGLEHPAGIGTVHIYPDDDHDWIRIDLTSETGTPSRCRVDREALTALLARSVVIRPPGQEYNEHEFNIGLADIMNDPY